MLISEYQYKREISTFSLFFLIYDNHLNIYEENKCIKSVISVMNKQNVV